jgi:hypothetical protein
MMVNFQAEVPALKQHKNRHVRQVPLECANTRIVFQLEADAKLWAEMFDTPVVHGGKIHDAQFHQGRHILA